MTWLMIIGIIVLIASFAEGPSSAAKRTKRLDPGGRDDFGGRL